MKFSKYMILLAFLGAAIAVWYFTRASSGHEDSQVEESKEAGSPVIVIKDDRSEAEKRAETAARNAEVSRSLRFDQSQAKLVNEPMDRSQLSEDALLLDDPEAEERDVMQALHSLLRALRYQSREKSFPVGLNVEVTNALLGDNSSKIAFLPRDSPRINENGELVDLKGNPYWFHVDLLDRLQIVSAGEDGLMHTADDVALEF